MDEQERYEAGLAVRRQVLGEAHVERSLQARTDFTTEFQDFITRTAWGTVWTREGLPRHTRSLLTIVMMVALGHDVAGLFTNDQVGCDQLAAAARAVGEQVWQLPMYAYYDEQIKSEVADIKNVGDGRWGGAITAAKFLERFVGGIPWTHVDIAGPAFAEKPRPWTDGGGTGSLVRPLVELARSWA